MASCATIYLLTKKSALHSQANIHRRQFDNMRSSTLVVAVLVLTFAYLVCSNPQRSTERSFVDQYREYYPEDEKKFFFNYTYGDDSKRVFFRSGNKGTLTNFNKNNNKNNSNRGDGKKKENKRPTYVSDIDLDERPFAAAQGGYPGEDEGYNYERPANGLSYDRPSKNKRAPKPYKVSFDLFKDE